jgi:transposase
LRSTAHRIQALKTEADDLEREIALLVTQAQPQLVQLPGAGPISAAQILISRSHPDRFRSETAFATPRRRCHDPALFRFDGSSHLSGVSVRE